MQILITFLTLVLVLNCFFLMLLVLIQLPKKEAGVGVAFGGGATDALFGAGSGNALTKLTKYTAVTFLGLSLGVGLLNVKRAHSGTSELRRALANQKPTAPVNLPAAATKPPQQFVPITSTNASLTINTNQIAATTNGARAVTTTSNTAANAPKTNAPAPK